MTRPPSSADWLEATERLAEASRQPGESREQAFARVIRKGAGAAFMAMHRQPQGRMPARVTITYKSQQAENAEAQLHRLAVERAAADGRSYEQAMAGILATPEGGRLWQQSRDEGPVNVCPD